MVVRSYRSRGEGVGGRGGGRVMIVENMSFWAVLRLRLRNSAFIVRVGVVDRKCRVQEACSNADYTQPNDSSGHGCS